MASSKCEVRVNGLVVEGLAQKASADYPKAVELFYGIPYAKVQRFKAAIPIALDEASPVGRLVASKAEPMSSSPMLQAPKTEDPLRLNIVRPATAKEKVEKEEEEKTKMPVVVYLHGGGFNFSNPLERDHAAFVAYADKDVLLVSVSYRLGALGFLAGGENSSSSSEERNLGLRDQRVAVEWVRRWIGFFGGDAKDLTMLGVSAGAHSVGHHMLHPSPLPFRKAVLESGSPTSRSVLSASHPRTAAQHKLLVSQLRPPTASALASARLDDLFNAALMVWATHSNALTWPFQPVVDDHDPASGQVNVLPDLPVRMWGEYRRRLLETPSSSSSSSSNTAAPAVITGFCSHEGVDFVPKRGLATAADFRRFFANLIPAFSPDDLDALEALYADPVGNPLSPYRHTGREGPQWRRLHEAYGHYAYICPVIHTAHELASASPSSPVYLYEYAAVSSPTSPSAPHASHAAAVARDPRAIPASKPGLRAVSREMHVRWSAFCASPDGRLPEAQWPPFESPFVQGADPARAGKMLVFGAGNDEASGGKAPGVPVTVRTLTEREMDVCRFWWDRMELSQGTGERGVTTKTW